MINFCCWGSNVMVTILLVWVSRTVIVPRSSSDEMILTFGLKLNASFAAANWGFFLASSLSKLACLALWTPYPTSPTTAMMQSRKKPPIPTRIQTIGLVFFFTGMPPGPIGGGIWGFDDML